jgi:hypothetical protein
MALEGEDILYSGPTLPDKKMGVDATPSSGGLAIREMQDSEIWIHYALVLLQVRKKNRPRDQGPA